MGNKKVNVAPKNVSPTDTSVPDALTDENSTTEDQKDKALEDAQKEAEESKAEEGEGEDESFDEPVKMIEIMIPSSADFDGKEDVFGNANGKRFQIQRDIWVEVPEVYVNTLRDAVKTEYDRDPAGRIVGSRNVQRYPFQMR